MRSRPSPCAAAGLLIGALLLPCICGRDLPGDGMEVSGAEGQVRGWHPGNAAARARCDWIFLSTLPLHQQGWWRSLHKVSGAHAIEQVAPVCAMGVPAQRSMQAGPGSHVAAHAGPHDRGGARQLGRPRQRHRCRASLPEEPGHGGLPSAALHAPSQALKAKHPKRNMRCLPPSVTGYWRSCMLAADVHLLLLYRF